MRVAVASRGFLAAFLSLFSAVVPSCVAFPDYPGGDVDAALADPSRPKVPVCETQGYAESEKPGPRETIRATSCDLDGDGFDDAIFVNQEGPDDNHKADAGLTIQWGSADGSLGAPTTVIVGRLNGPALCGDFNGDGALDVVASSQDMSKVYVVPRILGTRTFGASIVTFQLNSPSTLVALDVDHDSKLDLLVQTTGTSNSGPDGPMLLRRGLGTGHFAPGTNALTAKRPIAIDVDGDGVFEVLDVGTNPPTLLHLKSDGTVASQSDLPMPECGGKIGVVSPLDRDRDGKMDLVVSCNDHVFTYWNLGPNGFSPCDHGPLTAMCKNELCQPTWFLDMNRDGKVDYVRSETCSFCTSKHFFGFGE